MRFPHVNKAHIDQKATVRQLARVNLLVVLGAQLVAQFHSQRE